MPDQRIVRGVELRYALALYLAQHGRKTVAELIDAMTHQGFSFAGRPSKAISDALRWEMGRDRVRRHGRGLYGPGQMPRSTAYRIEKRVLKMREEARGQEFNPWKWDGPTWT